jgi:hypothetical protein
MGDRGIERRAHHGRDPLRRGLTVVEEEDGLARLRNAVSPVLDRALLTRVIVRSCEAHGFRTWRPEKRGEIAAGVQPDLFRIFLEEARHRNGHATRRIRDAGPALGAFGLRQDPIARSRLRKEPVEIVPAPGVGVTWKTGTPVAFLSFREAALHLLPEHRPEP